MPFLKTPSQKYHHKTCDYINAIFINANSKNKIIKNIIILIVKPSKTQSLMSKSPKTKFIVAKSVKTQI